jgi:hypothetical protein
VASTYIKPKKECWLKGAIGSPMFGKGMVSGLRKLETFAPANRFETPMESKLEAFLLFHSDFAEIEKEFDQYCPFEALGMVRSEVRHGNYLAFPLNRAEAPRWSSTRH